MKNQKEHVIVTGGAGFIGSHLVELLLSKDFAVTVIDNFDPFYDKQIKLSNISSLINNPDLTFIESDILSYNTLLNQLDQNYSAIFHLAAKAGVRPSIDNPIGYQEVNVTGTQNMLEIARRKNIKQFVFASSSSVYGINKNIPWQESDGLLYPISPYASTKISAELMGHVYSHLYNIRFVSLRFFTVFGPRQRPDLAIHSFSKKIINNEPINFFGDGSTKRDYTYVTDIVSGVFNALTYNQSNYEVFNLGNHNTVSLKEMVETLESVFDSKAKINYMPEQMGDVSITYADIDKAKRLLNYQPKTEFKVGIQHFKNWLLSQST